MAGGGSSWTPDFGGHHHGGYGGGYGGGGYGGGGYGGGYGGGGGHDIFDWFPLLPGVLLALLIVWALLRTSLYSAGPLGTSLRRTPDTLRARWDAAVRTHASTARDFAAYECDPAAVLHLPELANTECPATARFVDAFAEAIALATDAYPGAHHAEQFVAAADRAHRAWRAAVDAAERSRSARFTPEERSLLTQVGALLAVAGNSALEDERRAAYRQARRRLAELERRTGWALPRRAAIVLEQHSRAALPPAGPAPAA